MTRKKPYSAFTELGLKQTLEGLKAEIKELYLADDVPWIIGYSGGKDSTAVLQLTWMAIAELPESQRSKTVHVISTDTMVENPIVASWVTHSLDVMRASAAEMRMPLEPNRLTPTLENSFWVNLIGKGYPTPRHKFRWCTDRLKIQPSNTFINSVVKRSGEAILLLGSRKMESSARSKVMKRHEKHRVRDRLSPNGNLPNTLVYTPIENWSNDDVWMFLMQVKNPWGYNNKDLLTMYQGASADGECPLVVDSSSPSCGDSRFGCWVCTLVDKDKSMTAMIQNDEEKEWMLPLLELRNSLDFRNFENASDRHLRDYRRMSGRMQLVNPEAVRGNTNDEVREIPGPYTQDARAEWLRKLLEAQTWIRKTGPNEVSNIELITLAEMQEIRRIWVVDKHELEDVLPGVYEEATGESYPGSRLDDNLMLGAEELQVLEEICDGERSHYEMIRELLSVERQQKMNSKRAGLFKQLERAVARHYFRNREEALEHTIQNTRVLADAKDGRGIESTHEESCDSTVEQVQI